MADKIEYSRMLVKRTDQTGEVPTVPPVTAVTLNQMIPTDLFVGEFFLNQVDDLLWIRTDNGILPISLSGSTGTTATPTLTQVLFQGNVTNGYNIDVSAGDTITYQGLTTGSTTNFLGLDASGNTIVSGVVPGTPDLSQVLFQGNTTNGNDIVVSSGDTIQFLGLTSGSTTTILGLDASGNTITTVVSGGVSGDYLPLSGGTVTGNTYFGATSGITIDQVNNRIGINTSNPQYYIDLFGTKSRLFYADTSGGVLQMTGDTFVTRMSVEAEQSVTEAGFSISMGVRNYDDVTFPGYGATGDTFIYASNDANGLNIINRQGTGKQDYIRFYAGQDANGTTPDIHIQGSGATRGYVGIGTTNPTEKLDIVGNTKMSGNLTIGTIGGTSPVINLGVDANGLVVTGTTAGVSPLEYTYSNTAFQNEYQASTVVSSNYQCVVGGDTSTINATSAPFCSIFGSTNCQITTKHNGKGYGTVIVGSTGSVIGGSSDSIANFGPGIYSTSTAENNGSFSVIIAGDAPFGLGNKIRYGADSNNGISGSILAGGYGSTISGLGQQSALIGGGLNEIQQQRSAIVAGESNQMLDSGTSMSSAYKHSFMAGGLSNTMTQSNRSSIIGGSGNTMTTKVNAHMIGTNGRTANDDNTTYTENQRSFGQIYNGYYDNGPGLSFTIDWNRGNSQKITITGNTSLTFTNNKDGAQYRLQVVNSGTYDITGATASGYSILCEGSALPNITNNGVDLCVLEVMGEDILVRHFANFGTP